jgi:hypothetical protein
MKEFVTWKVKSHLHQYRTEYSQIELDTRTAFCEATAEFFVKKWMASQVTQMLKVWKNWETANVDDKEDYISFLRKALFYDVDQVRDDPENGYTNPQGAFSETMLRWIIETTVDDNLHIEPIVPRPPGQGDIDLVEIRGSESNAGSLRILLWEIKASDNQAAGHNNKVYKQISDYPTRFFSITNELSERFAYGDKPPAFKAFLQRAARLARKGDARIQYGGFVTFDSKVTQKVSVLPNIHQYPRNLPRGNGREKCHHVSTLLLPNFRDLRMEIWRHLNLEIYEANKADDETTI